MRRIELLLVLLVSASVHASEHGAPAEHGNAGEHEKPADEAMAEHAARTSSRDVKIPVGLVARIEREYKEFLVKQDPGGKKEGIKRALINLNAELTQKHPAALHENVRVLMPTGGGVVDLSELVTPVRGAFSVKLAARREDGQPLTTSRVFFVSRAKRRILAGEEYGAGCGKYMEISTSFHKKWENSGLDVYTADQRYVSVLGGTFIFVEFAKEALYVGSVTFTDSRYPEMLCE